MKSVFIILILLIPVCYVAEAQQKVLELSSERTEEGYEIYGENRGYANQTVWITFSILQNLQVQGGTPYLYVVPPGRRKICTLKKIREDVSSSLRYSYRFFKGCVRTRVQPDIKYLLPVRSGESTHFQKMSYLNAEYGDSETPRNWNAGMFQMNQDDTVYAIRRGRVVEIDEQNTGNVTANYLFTREKNHVIVEHEDCTYARYMGLSLGSVIPEAGEYVEAGDPIGTVDGTGFMAGPHVAIAVYYLDADKVGNENKFPWRYVPMTFTTEKHAEVSLTNREIYTAVHPEEIIFQEMSKREIKRYMKRK